MVVSDRLSVRAAMIEATTLGAALWRLKMDHQGLYRVILRRASCGARLHLERS